jgi:RNA polymerase sigma-70 factor (ECF subfamily)
MSGPVEEFQGLMERVREGSEEAAWELVERYGDAVRRAVRRALNARLRPKFDSLDFVQLVWLSFFRQSEHALRFTQPAELVAFLAKMATNKVGLEVRRRLLTQKYNVNRESPLEQSVAEEVRVCDRQPAGIDVAIAREQWDRIVSGQPQGYRKIIQLRLQGLTNQEIADRLHIAQSTVRRFLKKLFRERLE